MCRVDAAAASSGDDALLRARLVAGADGKGAERDREGARGEDRLARLFAGHPALSRIVPTLGEKEPVVRGVPIWAKGLSTKPNPACRCHFEHQGNDKSLRQRAQASDLPLLGHGARHRKPDGNLTAWNELVAVVSIEDLPAYVLELRHQPAPREQRIFLEVEGWIVRKKLVEADGDPGIAQQIVIDRGIRGLVYPLAPSGSGEKGIDTSRRFSSE